MIGNTAPDAIKFMRDLAVEADTDAGGNVYISIAKQNSGYPIVVMDIISREEAPTQDSGSAVDTYRVQVDIFTKTSRDGGDASAFETAHNISFALRNAWSRHQSLIGDFDNAINSIQEVDHRTDFFPDNGVYQVSNDYMVRMNGSGTSVIASGITTQSNTVKRKKITLTYADFQTASTTNTIDLGFVLPAKGILRSITMQPTTYFSGGVLSNYFLKVGTTGEPDKYIFDQSVFTGETLPEAVMTGGTIESMTAATTFKITATSVGANLSAATAGEVSIWISYEVLN